MPEPFEPNHKVQIPEVKQVPETMKSIYRGIWAERLNFGQELPLGGSLFSTELTTKVELDFDAFENQLGSFTEENIKTLYEQNKDHVIDWLNKVGSKIDPYTYFLCYQAQQKMHQLLDTDPKEQPDSFGRWQMYSDGKTPKLSEMKGKIECAERAALGQYLLQRAGAESAYVSGITMQDVKDTDEFPEDHSFIVLKHPAKPESTLIFDIARPRSQHNVPRVLETDVPFNYDLLKDKDELLVGATEVLQGGRLWFGVGEPAAGHHEMVEKPERPE